MHETVFISQCIREIRANRPEVDSAAQCTVIACSFVVIPEVVSSADNSIFQEIIFRSDAGLKMAVLGREQVIEVKSHLQAVVHTERQVDGTTQSQSGRQFLSVQLAAQVGGLKSDSP